MSYQHYPSEPTKQEYREPDTGTGGQHPQMRSAYQTYQRQQSVEQPYTPAQVYPQHSQQTVQSFQHAQAYSQQAGAVQPYPANQNQVFQGYQHMNQQYQQEQQEYQRPYYPPGHYVNQQMPSPGNQPPYNEAAPVGPANGVVRMTDMGAVRAESRYETYRDPMGNLVESRQQTYEDKNQVRNNIRYWVITGITFVLSTLEIILLLRFIFRLLDANQDAGFITFLYDVSHPFVAAFNGIFNDQTLGKSGVFEASTLIAMIIYALIAWGLIALARVLFAPVQTSRQSVTTTRRSQL